jgi:fibronectin type 3 domain-containing protein
VNLSWDAPASSTDAVAGYHVYRSPNGVSSYQLLSATVNAPTTFTDNAVTSGQSYIYYVTSVDHSGVESVPSNQFGVTIP